MANKTILKWAGSKVRIMDQLRPHLPKAKRLVEPFAGSCAVMMNTDYEQYLIADVNQDLIDMYLVIARDPDTIYSIGFEKLILSVQNDSKTYYGTRDAFNKRHKSKCDQAWFFLYLNRLCYNGLCRYNKKGEFNVPYGKYKNPYFPEKEIISFIDRAKNADIVCLEWQDTLSLVEYSDGIYCDPPYMGGRDSFTQYHTAGFTDAEHEALAIALKDINDNQGNPITVSNSPQAKILYADLGFTIHEIEAPRTIAASGCRKPAKEIIAVLEGVK
ncbi:MULTISPECIES: DNA adenine methylase [Providencia]|uniref:DNA adenine methylase n=1 Tax=Providencia TaxID=586 RepID=UPI0015EB7C0E|nr:MULTISPECIES: Dam family site-specific DNA-(adenine-N6)-methyltransferase [Providencia]ELR5139230.1 Dam family site-specific DNA-(adenine-N6)-methyltransferase [Providencia rettgeri]QLQ93655.1 Dam family site-specific DNA-(adenine-N6)-methyltransferase [Providencia rettgeri]WEB84273.1 Dam family site-specific DNA-(adenine-N6)-methyltransferase [Providencia rettgeri]HCH7934591.1 Dam family site-specific DNA-(adenine-N6)-methyltransferase [Providencia rettgeri]